MERHREGFSDERAGVLTLQLSSCSFTRLLLIGWIVKKRDDVLAQ